MSNSPNPTIDDFAADFEGTIAAYDAQHAHERKVAIELLRQRGDGRRGKDIKFVVDGITYAGAQVQSRVWFKIMHGRKLLEGAT